MLTKLPCFTQGLGPAGIAAPAQFGGASARVASAPRPGYDASRSTGYEAPRSTGYDAPAAPHYEASRAPSYEPPRGLSYDAARGPVYEAHSSMAGGAQGTAATANPMLHGMAQMPTPYGSGQVSTAYGGHLQGAYGTAPQVSNRSAMGYEAPARSTAAGGGGGGNQGHR